MNLTLRPITEDDREFLLSLYAASRDEELRLVAWSDEQKRAFVAHQFEAQHDHYRSKFPDASFDVIMVDSTPAGRLYVFRDEEQIRILDISLVPERRLKGIGGQLVGQIGREADTTGRKLRIYLEATNPYIPVFANWGFLRTSSDDDFYWLYERSAGETQPASGIA